MLHDCLWSGQVKFVCTTRDKTPSRSPSVLSPASRMSPKASFYGAWAGPQSRRIETAHTSIFRALSDVVFIRP